MQLSEEEKLIREIKSDPGKFSILFDEYYQTIFGYIFRRVADYDIARDIASETFLKAFLNIRSFKWTGAPVSSWFYRIASNECLLYFRKRKYRPESLDNLITEISWDAADPVSTLEEKNSIEKEWQQHHDFLVVQKEVMQLPVSYQEVLALRYFEKMKIEEIAMILNKKTGTVKSLLSRGIKKLRKRL